MTKSYLCDPAKNTACTSALCFERGGPCGTTDDVRFAMRDLHGLPVEIVDEDCEKEDAYGKADRRRDRRPTDLQSIRGA